MNFLSDKQDRRYILKISFKEINLENAEEEFSPTTLFLFFFKNISTFAFEKHSTRESVWKDWKLSAFSPEWHRLKEVF